MGQLGSGGTACSTGYGCGTVFELSPGSGGTWTETILYEFCSVSLCLDGAVPKAGLIFDAAGNLYGTTSGGGAYSYGTVFELSPPSSPALLGRRPCYIASAQIAPRAVPTGRCQ
jgi:uncharacterized repeat protein (TIGR03803 family)